MPLEVGQTIDGKYRVVRRIGEGGMGTVYEGENVRIGRRVAIKVLHAHVAARPELAARFEREARAAARIGSDHICDVLDLGDLADGERYIVMEYLDGDSLEARLHPRKRISSEALVPMAFEMLDALATMHDAGVIHRDLKPANVFLSKTAGGRGEAVKVLDFGVSKFLPAPGESSDMTATGSLMGTPPYTSPEQARGQRDIDGRSDIYAASVIFYRALTGVLPFTAENFNELMFKIALEDPKPIVELAPEVDAELAAIVHKGLARAPEGRWETARKYQEAIVAWARKNGRLSLSMLRASTSERALVGAAKQESPRDGTPIAWSENGPEPPSALDPEKGTPTETIALKPAPLPAAGAPPPPAPLPPKEPSAAIGQTTASPAEQPQEVDARSQAGQTPRTRLMLPLVGVAAGALTVGAIAVVAMRPRADATPSTGSASATTTAVATTTASTTQTATTEPPTLAPLEPAEPTATSRVAPRVAPRATAITTATAAASTAAPSSTASAAPTGSAKGRKFRTNLD